VSVRPRRISRSLLKLVLVLLVVGVLPFAASLLIVNDLLSTAVSVGLNSEVEAHLEASAETHRRHFDAEKNAHELAADLIAADPRWVQRPADEAGAVLDEYREVHPALAELTVSEILGPPRLPGLPTPGERFEWRELPTSPPLRLELRFSLPMQYLEEMEALGATLRTFDTLESVEDELTRGMRVTYLAFAGAVALLALILGTFLARRTTRRIDRIAAAANLVAAGDLTVRVEDPGHDELGDLARRFSNMVEELEASHQRVAYLQRVSAWQEIARRLAHEIKNPLTPILLAMQQIDRKFDELRDTPDQFEPILRDALEIVHEEIETLRGLVKEFSDFARLPKVAAQPKQAATFVRDFLRTNPQLDQVAEISLELVGPEDALVPIDAIMMRRALVNLVENAVQAVVEHDSGAAPEIGIRLAAGAERVVLTIDDNGPGVTQSDAEHLFDPYFTTKSTGTGLGLPIVKKIVLDHGGRIEIGNRSEGGGCRVRLSLPRCDV